MQKNKYLKLYNIASLWGVLIFILFANLAFADASTAAPIAEPQASPIAKLLPLFAIITAIYYFLILSPQKNELKKKTALLEGLKNGDNVVTSSGMYGRVSSIESDHIVLEVATNIKLKFDKSHIEKKI